MANRGAMNQHRASASPRKSSVRVTYLKIVTYTLLNKGRADRSSNQDEKPKSVTKYNNYYEQKATLHVDAPAHTRLFDDMGGEV